MIYGRVLNVQYPYLPINSWSTRAEPSFSTVEMEFLLTKTVTNKENGELATIIVKILMEVPLHFVFSCEHVSGSNKENRPNLKGNSGFYLFRPI